MMLVIDTNRLIAALLKSSVSRKIILSNKFEFYTPDLLITEIWKYRDFYLKR